MIRADGIQPGPLLVTQIRWLIGLRWLAGATVIVGGLADGWWLKWYPQPLRLVLLGVGILLYNAALWAACRRHPPLLPRRPLLWTQIVPDLVCLATLTLWTGGADSPLLGFFVFHMVFASLIMSRPMAYAVAVLAVGLMGSALAITGSWPQGPRQQLGMVGWGITLLLTIYLTNHIVRSLHRHRRRLMAQNRKVRALVSRLHRQQQAMVQHEKMVGLGQMAAGVAHEINNPLASIDGLLQLMQRNDKHVTPENVALLRQQGERIREIVQQLTRFAHPTEYTWDTVGLDDLIESALQVVRFDRRRRQVKIEHPRPRNDQECNVRVQPHAVQQALVNILMNALDATAGLAEPHIKVQTASNGHDYRINISDNGPGIPPENLPRLFEPFFTTKPVGQGTGLGLAISYSLLRNQGGRIEVASQVGQGTTFSLILPKVGQEGEKSGAKGEM